MLFHLAVNTVGNRHLELMHLVSHIFPFLCLLFYSLNRLTCQVIQQFSILVIVHFLEIHQLRDDFLYRVVKIAT